MWYEASNERKENNDEDAMLDDFFSEVENVSETSATTRDKEKDNDTKNKKKNIVFHRDSFSDTTSSFQIDWLIILSSSNADRKNQSFLCLATIFSSSIEEIQKRYRSLSLLVHPDKISYLSQAS